MDSKTVNIDSFESERLIYIIFYYTGERSERCDMGESESSQ